MEAEPALLRPDAGVALDAAAVAMPADTVTQALPLLLRLPAGCARTASARLPAALSRPGRRVVVADLHLQL